jgi:squalene-hopene/tetraprenyl-beta-curcumene cyclase
MLQVTFDALSQAGRALEAGRDHLLSLQDEGGWWRGELQTNVTMDAEDILLREFLGIRRAEATVRSAAWIRSQQRADGTWANFFEGPGDLSTTIEAYWALRLAGDTPQDEHMRMAAEFIRAQGGIECARVFTHLWLALFGLWSWERVPALPPEIVLLSPRIPLNVYDFACWARQTIVALALVKARRPVRALEFDLAELWAAPGEPVAGRLAGRARSHAAHLGAPPDRAAAAARVRPRRALDRTSAGGRRLLGRHPAAVGLLADRPAPVRLSAGASRHAPGPGGHRALHDRG